MSIIDSKLACSEYSFGCSPRPKKKYWGFTEIKSPVIGEMRDFTDFLGFYGIRIFQYNEDLKYQKLLRFILPEINRSHPLIEFLNNPLQRGIYKDEQRALFVKQNDPFAVCHELGHVFVHAKNPKLLEKYASGFEHPRKIEDYVALCALDEGASQWVAIEVGLRSGESSRIDVAIEEKSRLAVDLQEIIASIKQATIDYQKLPHIGANFVPEYIQQTYVGMLVALDRPIISLGYHYTASCMEKLSSGLSIADKLSLIIKNPPTFAELEQEVASFTGFANIVR